MTLRVNDFVRVKRYPVVKKGVLTQGRVINDSEDPDYMARVQSISHKNVWIVNGNMPFMGTINALIPISRIYEFVEKVKK